MKYTPLTNEQVETTQGFIKQLLEEKVLWERRKDAGDKLAVLTALPEFNDVFMEFYCKEELHRKVGLITEQHFMDHSKRMELQDDITGVAVFRDWLQGMANMDTFAEAQLTQIATQIKLNEGYISNGIPEDEG
jgi:hypothetical protein